jgi:hypothetical protein
MANCSSIRWGGGVVLGLYLLCVSTGCASRAPARSHAEDLTPARGGTIRILSGDPFSEKRLMSGLLLGEPPLLQRIVRIAGDPLLLYNLGEVDLAVTYGRDADLLASGANRQLDMTRLPGQDRIYYLWLNPGSRWTNDPTFRRWLAGTIDRAAMLDYLFAGRGQPLVSFLDQTLAVPFWEPVARRPLSRETVPRIQLAYEQADPRAQRITARITAGLTSEDVEVTPRALSTANLRAALRDDSNSINAALLLVGGSTDETDKTDGGVLTLLEAISDLGPESDGIRLHLEQASRLTQPGDRQAAAQAAEDILLSGATLVPLIRLEAWLATDPALSGIEIGPHDLLLFHKAGWAR